MNNLIIKFNLYQFVIYYLCKIVNNNKAQFVINYFLINRIESLLQHPLISFSNNG